jgi:hypothetical protein
LNLKGLKAQYIGYLAAGLVALLLLFTILYVTGVPIYLCLAIIAILGTVLFTWVYKYSHKYGRYGLMKKAASKAVPFFIITRSRKVFIHLSKQDTDNGTTN